MSVPSASPLSTLCDEVMLVSRTVQHLREDILGSLQKEVVEVLHDDLTGMKAAISSGTSRCEELFRAQQRETEVSLSALQHELRGYFGRELNGHSSRLAAGIIKEGQSLRTALRSQASSFQQQLTWRSRGQSLPAAVGGGSHYVEPKDRSCLYSVVPPHVQQASGTILKESMVPPLASKSSAAVSTSTKEVDLAPLLSTPRFDSHAPDNDGATPMSLMGSSAGIAEMASSRRTESRNSKLVHFDDATNFVIFDDEALKMQEAETIATRRSRTSSWADEDDVSMEILQSHAPSERFKAADFTHVQELQATEVKLPGTEIFDSIADWIGWHHLGDVPEDCLARAASSPTFTILSIIVIFTNAIWMGIEVEVLMRITMSEEARDTPEWFIVVNRAYVGIFLAELAFRLIGLRMAFFFGQDWRWNVLDFVLVLFGLASQFIEASASQNVSMVRMLRILRVCRALKIVRVLRFFRELQVMLCSIAASLAALTWSFGLLFIIIYIFSIFFMHGVMGEVDNHKLQSDPESVEWMDYIGVYYASLYDTMVALLMAISGGADWGDVAKPLTKASKLYHIAFMGYIVFVVFGVLNVLVGIFVSAAAENLDKELLTQMEISDRKKFTQDMHDFFAQFASGENISKEQFHKSLAKVEVQAYMETNHLHFSDAQTLFGLLDKDNSGEICLDEFVNGCQHLRGLARCSDMAFIIEQVKIQQEFSRESLKQIRNVQKQLKAMNDESS
mmetsp:Transcript_2433/g.5216  ORF Transcript_2433/g.5216 Transcript_2433/m.5216 type:complete len:732 (-) Transcript_2433:191-2386(-)